MKENYPDLQTAAKKITGNDDLWEELLHFVLEDFLYKTKAEEIILSGGAKFYIIRMLTNNYRSSTSPFHLRYRQIKTLPEAEQIQEPEIFQEHSDSLSIIQNALEQLPWYDKMLFEVYVKESHTISSLSRATGIPRSSVNLTLTRVKNYLKNSIQFPKK